MRKPNIILINCDDLGYGDLGCYGSTVNDTPYIDHLCQNGRKLTDFYMGSPVCSPSRGAMMTGCYPPRIGFGTFDGEWVLFPGQGIGLSHGEKTIAQMLREQDYATMIIGKWHCGDQREFLPTRYGFDHYYGLPYSNDMGRQAGPSHREAPPLPLIDGEEVIQQQPDQASLTERYTERAVRFLRDNKDNPFFLYYAHMHVHLPHYAQQRFNEKSRNGEYGASVGEVDWSVGVLLDELRSLGLAEDTMIIFTSDNGSNLRLGGSNGPLRGAKGSTWEGGIRVPCIWYWPGHIQPGESGEIVSSLDFYATLAAMSGGTLPEHKIDSLDVSEAVLRNGRSGREVFFYYLMDNLEAVRRGPWKLKVQDRYDRMYSLYNLNDDPGERADQSRRHPEVAAELEALMAKCRADIGDFLTGTKGQNVRPAGKIDDPVTLTAYDENHPYIVAMYDKDDKG